MNLKNLVLPLFVGILALALGLAWMQIVILRAEIEELSAQAEEKEFEAIWDKMINPGLDSPLYDLDWNACPGKIIYVTGNNCLFCYLGLFPVLEAKKYGIDVEIVNVSELKDLGPYEPLVRRPDGLISVPRVIIFCKKYFRGAADWEDIRKVLCDLNYQRAC